MSKASPNNHDAGNSTIPDEQQLPSSGLYSEQTLPDGWNYEATVEAIESIINRIETGEMELADIFDQFAIAVDHLRQCESFLDHHSQHVDLLIETLSD